jgi:hypothetical protein
MKKLDKIYPESKSELDPITPAHLSQYFPSRRDYFAACALNNFDLNHKHRVLDVQIAIEYADEMIKQLDAK